MIVILKLISLIYILTFALKPFEMMEMTSEYLKLIPIKRRSDCTAKHLFMTFILTGRFVVLYSVFFYQIVNDFVRLITQDQVTTTKQQNTEKALPLKNKTKSAKLAVSQPTTDSIDKSIRTEPTLLSNNTTSSSAESITESTSVDSSADKDLDVPKVNKDDDLTKHAGNAADIPIKVDDVPLEVTMEETVELPDESKQETTIQAPLMEDTQEEHKIEDVTESEIEKQVEEVNLGKVELTEETEDKGNEVKEAEKPEITTEENQVEEIEIKEAEEEIKSEQVEKVEIKESNEEKGEPVEQVKVEEHVEPKQPEQDDASQQVEQFTEKENKDDKTVQPTLVAQEEIDPVVEEFPMAPNNEPQQAAPSTSLKSSRRMSEGSATPALTTSSSGSPASRRSSYNSSVVNTQQPSKLLSKINPAEEPPTPQTLRDRPPSRFMSLRIGGNKNKSPEEPPQPKVSISSKLKSSFKFMKKVKGSSKRSSQLLQ